MTLPTYNEALAASHDESAFSNGTEVDCWMARNCGRCIHDKPARLNDYANACPLPLIAYADRTPAEWVETNPKGLEDRYTCVYFRPEDDPGPDEPAPTPDPPGQLTLCPREPYERPARMYVDTRPVEATAPV
ncbi:hypothetical protein ACFYY8_31255 [Streptosporangium sp. NPDC001559]|uniref:hypothetical protein n=1 Tax=Streptosporangium sp. NPDC001559 TaxID=3366187 RepID=UPI0036DFE70F